MTSSRAVLALSLALACAAAQAVPPLPVPPPKPRTMQEILDASAPTDWRRLDPANTLLMELDGDRRIVIELAPQFAPEHVANIRALAKGRFWNGLSINRSQDGFVVQWGDPEEAEGKRRPLGAAKAKLPAEVEVRATPSLDAAWSRLPDVDGWAPEVGFLDGFYAARDPKRGAYWPTHCYGMVGAGRGTDIDSSNGAELYVVIGQSPRQLDRNITTVGRVVQGMEWLSTVPRGTGPLGFFEKPEQRVPIRAVRLMSDVPAAERIELEALRTDTPLFFELVEARRNRRDDFYKVPAGHIDLCNVPLPVRAVKK
ncbi:peptidylprolyl isomerase [Lysobacter humi (ex Lee et al. 2017)]